MNYEIYAPVLEKAREALAEKKIAKTKVSFSDVRITKLRIKIFRFVSKAKRKMMRRLKR